MKLNLLERLTLLKILPKENSFLTLKVVRGLTEKLGVEEKEFKEFGIIQDKKTGQITWNEKGTKEKEFEIGEKENDIIIESLKGLDKEKKLVTEHLTLYEKFVE